MNNIMEEDSDLLEDDEPHWLAEARTDVEYLMESLELNPVANEAGIVIPQRYKRDPTTWFSSWDDMEMAVADYAESIASANAPFEGGVPVFEIDVSDLTLDVLTSFGVYDFFESLRVKDASAVKIFDPSDFAAGDSGALFRGDITEVNGELIRYLSQHPDKMHQLTPRKYEELIAELFKDKGYDIELTPSSGDGGKDIICTHHGMAGSMLIYVECKKYAPENAVGVEIVRGLHGVITSDKATKGVIATTSRFTKGARDFHSKNQYHLSLADFDVVTQWLKDYRVR